MRQSLQRWIQDNSMLIRKLLSRAELGKDEHNSKFAEKTKKRTFEEEEPLSKPVSRPCILFLAQQISD